jgi:phospholipase C
MRMYARAGLLAGFLTLVSSSGTTLAQSQVATTTPIQHVVVIFDENISFDHYFATYPKALNPAGEPAFTAAANTPTVNGLTPSLLQSNPNPAQPFRLDRSQFLTCDNDNAYTDEQTAYHGGLIDKVAQTLSATGAGCTPNLSMGYYDGNTVTAVWNYAQHFSMSDNFFATTFGTTVMGHLNLISGQTHQTNLMTAAGKVANGSITANVQAGYDDCGATPTVVQMSGTNVGQLLNAKGVTWGWFYGDFAPTSITNGVATCGSLYNNHYDPFQYYQATANPHHLPPTSTAMIGQNDQANHQYALTDLWNAVAAGNLPEVTFIKASSVSTGHPATSNPLAEQTFLVQTINALQQSPQWPSMAILITYDDSDGWYDHVMPPIVNPSNDSGDTLAGAGKCGTSVSGAYQDRCGYGPRLPFLVISPFAKQNNVDHTVNDQTSILRFIEDNWGLPRIGDQSFDALAGPILSHFDFNNPHYGTVLLNPTTGEVTGKKSGK